jgi:hypothetical protein
MWTDNCMHRQLLLLKRLSVYIDQWLSDQFRFEAIFRVYRPILGYSALILRQLSVCKYHRSPVHVSFKGDCPCIQPKVHLQYSTHIWGDCSCVQTKDRLVNSYFKAIVRVQIPMFVYSSGQLLYKRWLSVYTDQTSPSQLLKLKRMSMYGDYCLHTQLLLLRRLSVYTDQKPPSQLLFRGNCPCVQTKFRLANSYFEAIVRVYRPKFA